MWKYTTDELGNTVLSIETGISGIKMLENMGIKNTISPEDYKKHIKSCLKKEEKQKEEFLNLFKSIFNVDS